MVIRYFQSALKRTGQLYCSNSAMKRPSFVGSSILVTKPLYWAATNPGWGKFTVHQSFEVKAQRKRGFRQIPLNSTEAKMGGGFDQSDAFGGWVSSKSGSFIKFSFQVPTSNWSLAIVLRRMKHNTGLVHIWLDKNKRDAVTVTGKSFSTFCAESRVYFVASDAVSRGHHTISLETKGQKVISLLVSGIVLGPAGMKEFQGYRPTGTLEKVWSPEDYQTLRLNQTK